MLAVTMFMSLSLVPFALDAVWPLNESRPIMPVLHIQDTISWNFENISIKSSGTPSLFGKSL